MPNEATYDCGVDHLENIEMIPNEVRSLSIVIRNGPS